MVLKPGAKSSKNLIYKCNYCGNLQAMIKKEVASHCDICKKNNNKQLWLETKKEIVILSRNIKSIIESKKTISDKISDRITQFCGHIFFIYIHIVLFGIWIFYNNIADNPFDPYPFGMLTLVVSLEAIIISSFILVSQNQQGEITNLRAEADYQTDLKAEKKIAEILAILKTAYKDSNKIKKW